MEAVTVLCHTAKDSSRPTYKTQVCWSLSRTPSTASCWDSTPVLYELGAKSLFWSCIYTQKHKHTHTPLKSIYGLIQERCIHFPESTQKEWNEMSPEWEVLWKKFLEAKEGLITWKVGAQIEQEKQR